MLVAAPTGKPLWVLQSPGDPEIRHGRVGVNKRKGKRWIV